MSDHDKPKTDYAIDAELRKFMQLSPTQRDEALWLQQRAHKEILGSSAIRTLPDIMNGTTDKPGLVVRVDWMEHKIQKLTRSNDRLTKALYIATGAYFAIKFLSPIIEPLLHK